MSFSCSPFVGVRGSVRHEDTMEERGSQVTSGELPRNIEAERALIGACLVRGRIEGRAEQVSPDHFSDRAHAAIWSAMQKLAAHEDPLDIISVTASLKGSPDIGPIEAPALLTKMIGEVPSSVHADKYAELTITTHAKRKLAVAMQRVARIAYGDGAFDPMVVFANAISEIEQASEGIQPIDRDVWTAAELANLEVPADPWLLDGLLVDGGLNLLAGEFRAGKSFACLDLALTVASGGGLAWGRNVGKGSVLFYGADNGRNDLIRRIRDLSAGRGINPPHESLIIDLSPLDLGKQEGIAILESSIRDHGPRLVIIDALVRYMGGLDESSAGDVAPMMAGFRRLTNRHGCTILLIHHLRKVSGERTRNRLIDRVRGSGDLVGAVDSALVMTVSGQGSGMSRNLVHVKCREATEADPSSFTIMAAEKGGLILAFEAADIKEATATLVETTAAMIIDLLQKSEGVTFTRADLTSELSSIGMRPSERTLKSAFSSLKTVHGISIGKQGRKYTYMWSTINKP
jgi:hypothetical protein